MAPSRKCKLHDKKNYMSAIFDILCAILFAISIVNIFTRLFFSQNRKVNLSETQRESTGWRWRRFYVPLPN